MKSKDQGCKRPAGTKRKITEKMENSSQIWAENKRKHGILAKKKKKKKQISWKEELSHPGHMRDQTTDQKKKRGKVQKEKLENV